MCTSSRHYACFTELQRAFSNPSTNLSRLQVPSDSVTDHFWPTQYLAYAGGYTKPEGQRLDAARSIHKMYAFAWSSHPARFIARLTLFVRAQVTCVPSLFVAHTSSSCVSTTLTFSAYILSLSAIVLHLSKRAHDRDGILGTHCLSVNRTWNVQSTFLLSLDLSTNLDRTWHSLDGGLVEPHKDVPLFLVSNSGQTGCTIVVLRKLGQASVVR
jgi:hypothetical protein